MKGRPILLFLMLVAASPYAHAGNPGNGQQLARSLCTNCHIVEPGGASRQVAADVPSFMAIANKAGRTADTVQAFILNPHPPMPQVQLTTNELADVAAYIMSLKN